ncbi:hypothetical protein DL766_000126 [Monosporascus sp. MC13-8B]|uniref:Cytochrome P450 n=1 Tax=Monosporascus cannonballus TaxID=155416 RepID=A0ABY0GXH5_9PEZI|nr:hypothetical protein DL762_008197 [Monosporascus cannonballus]RYP40102.1 hypothetical protein DL766_000126 [Monosporascus sp. MC13-8B]
MAKDVLQKRLTPSLGLVTEDISEEATLAFKDRWTDNTEWHALDAKATLVKIIARLSSRVFLGHELCRSPAWLRITIDYTMTVFRGVMALKRWPSFLRPVVWRFVPEVRRVNEQIDEAVHLITPIIKNKAESNSSSPETTKPARLDVFQWASEVANGRRYDPTLLQLGFSMASMHNTTDLATQVLYDLCAHPEYIEPLRKEVETVLEEEGMTKAGLARFKLMDSFMKESQRIKPSELHDSTSDPTAFDGYRFLKMIDNPQKEKTRHFVSTSPDHMGFGHGKHACPGRFFAAHEVKIILCHVLMKYDFKLVKPDSRPTVLEMGWALIAEPGVQLMVKRREGVDQGLLHR